MVVMMILKACCRTQLSHSSPHLLQKPCLACTENGFPQTEVHSWLIFATSVVSSEAKDVIFCQYVISVKANEVDFEDKATPHSGNKRLLHKLSLWMRFQFHQAPSCCLQVQNEMRPFQTVTVTAHIRPWEGNPERRGSGLILNIL